MKRFSLAIGIAIGIAGYHYYPEALRYYHQSVKPATVKHSREDDDRLLEQVLQMCHECETPAERQTRELREWKEEEQIRFDALQKAVKDAEAIDIDGLQSAADALTP